MGTLQALKHVATAVRHAEVLSDEAEDAGEIELALRLRVRGERLATDVEDAVAAHDIVNPLREARVRAHAYLDAQYSEVTVRLAAVLGPDDLSRLSPGGYLDVVERTRFRARRMAESEDPRVREIHKHLLQQLTSYDDAVDAYLVACADAQGKKDRAVVRSQALRLELDAAKARLLVRTEVGSDAWARIKRRCVRTKRARWIEDARARNLLGEALAPITASPG